MTPLRLELQNAILQTAIKHPMIRLKATEPNQ
jgi:hypothetical protein